MKTMLRLLFMALWVAPLGAALPLEMNYQGRMLNSAGMPVPDAAGNSAVFRIYNVATGGAALWTENRTGIATAGGLFNVILGQVTPINLTFNADYWLGIAWAGDTEMLPRQKLSTAPYAFRAKYLDTPATLSGASGPVLTVQNTAGGIALSSSTVDSAAAAIAGQNSAITGNAMGIYGNTMSNAGYSIYGLQNVASNTGYGVYANNNGTNNSGAGLRGSNGSASGIGVLADNQGGGWALVVSGNARFDGAGNTATFYSYVSFVAGTNLSTSVAAPLSLTSPSAAAALYALNNFGGKAIVAQGNATVLSVTSSGDNIPAAYISMSGSGRALELVQNGYGEALFATGNGSGLAAARFYNPVNNGRAIYAQSLNGPGVAIEAFGGQGGVYGFANNVTDSWGVQGDNAASTRGYGLYGSYRGLDPDGAGLLARVGTGGPYTGLGYTNAAMLGFNPSNSGVGLYLRATGTSAVGIDVSATAAALRLGGSSAISSSAGSIHMWSYVSFTAGSNLSAAVPVPLVLSGTVAFPGGVISATNTGSGHGISGYVSSPGQGSNGGSPSLSTQIPAGVFGFSSASNSAGVLGHSSLTTTAGGGVGGLGYIGVIGFGRDDLPGSAGGSFGSGASSGIGINASAVSGTAVSAVGLTGVAVAAMGPGGTGLVIAVTNGAQAILAVGPNTHGKYLAAVSQSNSINGGTAFAAFNSSTSSAAVYGISLDTSLPSSGVSGIGVAAQGPIGLAAGSTVVGGVGVYGTAAGGIGVYATGAMALQVSGNAKFDGIGNTVTFNSYVSFTAGTNLAGGVPNPLQLSNTVAVAVLEGANYGSGAGVSGTAYMGYGVYARSMANHAIYATSNSGSNAVIFGVSTGSGHGVQGIAGAGSSAGVFGSGDGVTNAGLRGTNSGSGPGVEAKSVLGTAITADGSTLGLSATASAVAGVAGYFQGETALVAQGQSLGLSAVADAFGGTGLAAIAADGNAIYARNNGPGGFKASILADASNTNHAIEGRQLMSGAVGILGGSPFGMNSGVYGTGPIGVWGVGAVGSDIGVYGSINSNGADGRSGVRAENTAQSLIALPAIALDIDGGISYKLRPAGDDPAGAWAVSLNNSVTGKNYSGSGTITNNQIENNTIILLTPVDASGVYPPGTLLSANVTSQGNGFANFEVAAFRDVCCLSAQTITVNYILMTPR